MNWLDYLGPDVQEKAEWDWLITALVVFALVILAVGFAAWLVYR